MSLEVCVKEAKYSMYVEDSATYHTELYLLGVTLQRYNLDP